MSNKISVELTATSNAFTSVMHAAEGSLHHLTETAAHAGEGLKSKLEGLGSSFLGGGIESMIQGLSGGLTHMAGSAASALGSLGPIGMGLGVIAVGAAAAAAAVVGFAFAVKSIVEPQMEMIDSTNKMAQALGVPTDQLMNFHNIAKREGNLAAEDVDKAMKHLAKSIGEAIKDPASEAGQAFEKMGLDAKKFDQIDMGKNFTAVVDRLKDVNDLTSKAVVSTTALGKQGLEISNAFKEGAEGIAAAHAKGLKQGTVLSTEDIAKVVGAKKVFEDIGATIEGVKNKITVALAPTIEALGNKILELLPTADSFASGFLSAVKVVGYVVAGLMDEWSFLKVGIYAVGVAAFGFAETTLKGIGMVTEAVVALANFFGADWKMPAIFTDGEAMAKQIKDSLQGKLDQSFDDLGQKSAVSKWGKSFDDMQKDAAKPRDLKGEGIAKALIESAAEAQKKVHEILEGIKKDLDFEKFLSSGEGIKLKAQGLSNDDIKKISEVKTLKGSDAQVADATKSLGEISKLRDATKASDAIEEMRRKFTAMQTAINAGLDPKTAEEIAKLKLTPAQADDYNKLAAGIKKLEEATKVKDKIKDLKDEVMALKLSTKDHLVTKDDIQAERLGVSKADLKEQNNLEQVKKNFEESKKIVEDSLTPLQKYQQELDKIDKLQAAGVANGGLNNHDADAARKKAAAQYDKDDTKVESGFRRFGLDVGRTASEIPKAHLDEAKKQSQYQMDMRNDIRGGLVGQANLDDFA